jgi:DNA-directed RNA polymerase alpha subunit
MKKEMDYEGLFFEIFYQVSKITNELFECAAEPKKRSCNLTEEQYIERWFAAQFILNKIGDMYMFYANLAKPGKNKAGNGTPLDGLGLSVRSCNFLKNNGVETIEQLTEKTYSDLLLMRNMGNRCANEIQSKLEAKGMHLKEEKKRQ